MLTDRWMRPVAAGLLLGFALAALAGTAWAYGYGSGSTYEWTHEDREEVRKARERRLRSQVETYKDAFKTVQEEEERAKKALQQGVTKAEAGPGDEVAKKRNVRLARFKGMKAFKQVDFKYGRLYTAIAKLSEEKGIPADAKGGADILLTQVRDAARENREFMADLYEKVDEPIQALKLLEGIYKGLPDAERAAAGDLKGRIKSLKERLGIRDASSGM